MLVNQNPNQNLLKTSEISSALFIQCAVFYYCIYNENNTRKHIKEYQNW